MVGIDKVQDNVHRMVRLKCTKYVCSLDLTPLSLRCISLMEATSGSELLTISLMVSRWLRVTNMRSSGALLNITCNSVLRKSDNIW